MVKLACGHGVDIILQKPLAPEWSEAREVVETARKAGVRLAIHENFRYQSPMRKLKGVLDSGAIGKPTWARIAFRTGYDIYAVQPYLHQAKRYAILDVGIHMLDLARFFLGDVERVSCETQTRNPENVGEDTATILMRHHRARSASSSVRWSRGSTLIRSRRRWSRSRAIAARPPLVRASPRTSRRAARPARWISARRC